MKKNEKKNNKKKIPIGQPEEQKTERKKTNWKLVGELLQGHRRYIVFATISVLLATAFSYAVPYVTSFTLDYVIQGITTSTPKFLLPIIESLGGRSYFVNSLFLCGIALFLFTGMNCLFTFTRRQNIAYASEGLAEKLRNRLYRHLEDVPYDYHKHASTGDLVQRCTSDVDTVRRFVHLQLMEIVRTFVMFGLAAVVMFSVNVKMTLISLAFLPFLTISSFVYFKYVQRYFTGSDEAEGALSTMLQENLTGVRVVRAFGQQKSEIDKFTKLNETYRVKTYKLIKLLGFYWGLSDSVGYIQIALSLCMGVIGVYRGTFTLGNVAMFTTYVAMLTWLLCVSSVESSRTWAKRAFHSVDWTRFSPRRWSRSRAKRSPPTSRATSCLTRCASATIVTTTCWTA
ncbi:MAG: ABC transporter ATP-binding protein [Eubacteriales bacterium]